MAHSRPTVLVALSVLSAVLTGVASAAAECEFNPYNCRVPNYEVPSGGQAKDPNRKYNDFDKTYFWSLVNVPQLKDGTGFVRGTVKEDARFNFGQRKTLGGASHVYAWAVSLVEGGTVSGWIPESAVYRKATMAKMPTTVPDMPNEGFYETDWVVTGGNVNDAGELLLNNQYGTRKVNPNVPVSAGEKASDYLVRNWDSGSKKGYVNHLYNLPGVGGVTTDTLPLCMHFKRFKGVNRVELELYFADSAQKSDLTLSFDFGDIQGRRGWMTKEMLTASDDLGTLHPSHPCYVGKPNPQGAGGSGTAGTSSGTAGEMGTAGQVGTAGQMGTAGTPGGAGTAGASSGVAGGAGAAGKGTGGKGGTAVGTAGFPSGAGTSAAGPAATDSEESGSCSVLSPRAGTGWLAGGFVLSLWMFWKRRCVRNPALH